MNISQYDPMILHYQPTIYSELIINLSHDLHLPPAEVESLISPLMIASYVLELPHSILEQANQIAKTLYNIQKNNSLASPPPKNWPPLDEKQFFLNPGGFSSSIDCHYDRTTETLKIIELNTNASFLGLSLPLYKSANIESTFLENNLKQNLFTYFSPATFNDLHIAIVDENPKQQKLYIEFLYFKNKIEKWGAQASICDPKELNLNTNLIYNRVTDFYLESNENKNLFTFWQTNPQSLTPNPYNYLNFADKNNLIKWGQLPEINKFIPSSVVLDPKNQEDLWKNRKKWFFKPNHSFGSKMTFRGESISRKNFELLRDTQQSIVQEFIPAPELPTDNHGRLKFDLRFYNHKDQIIQTLARVYQGQVTNSKTPGGGFACIKWV